MSREFDGVDDQAVATITGPNGAYTLLEVVRIMSTSDTIWHSFIEIENSGTLVCGLGRSDAGLLYAYVNGTQDDVPFTDSDGWALVAHTKTAGSTTPILHKIIIGGAATHTAVPFTTGAPASVGNTLRLGGNDDFSHSRRAVSALIRGVALSNAELEGIATAKTTQSIADLCNATTDYLYDDSNGFTTNLLDPGRGDLTKTGTTDNADDPSGWVYGLSGGTHSMTLTPVTSTNSAQALTKTKQKILSPALSTQTAIALTKSKRLSVTPATGTNTAVALTKIKQVVLVPGSETNEAQVLDFSQAGVISKTLTPVVETDSVQTLVAVKTIYKTIVSAEETDNAITLLFTGGEAPTVTIARAPIVIGRF